MNSWPRSRTMSPLTFKTTLTQDQVSFKTALAWFGGTVWQEWRGVPWKLQKWTQSKGCECLGLAPLWAFLSMEILPSGTELPTKWPSWVFRCGCWATMEVLLLSLVLYRIPTQTLCVSSDVSAATVHNSFTCGSFCIFEFLDRLALLCVIVWMNTPPCFKGYCDWLCVCVCVCPCVESNLFKNNGQFFKTVHCHSVNFFLYW